MPFPRSILSFALFSMVGCSFAATARADMLWYNGNYDNRDSLADQSNVPVIVSNDTYTLTTSLVYDNFVVPTGQSWTLSSVYVNELVKYTGGISTATWQILSGVSAGNGGTVVASGDTTATTTVNIAYSPQTGYTGDQISAAVSGVTLGAGTYWLAVAPDSAVDFGNQAYALTTSGAGAVGTPTGNDGNSYVTNNFPTSGPDAYYFTPTTTALSGDNDGPLIDFSMGVNGTSLAVVPEPSSVVMVVIGLTAPVIVWARRRPARAA